MGATQTIDRGKRIRALYPGECSECGGTIETGDEIYFSRGRFGSRHIRCVDGGDDRRPQPPREDAAPRAATTFAASAPATAAETPRAAPDDAARAARDGASVARDGGGPAAARDDVYTAPARETTFGRAGDRDAVRRELAEVIELLMAAMERGVAALERIAKVLR